MTSTPETADPAVPHEQVGQSLVARWSARPGWILLILLLLGTGLRVSHWQSLRDTSCFESWRHGEMDMQFFHLWARDIAAGDWLGREARHPQHDWHFRITAALIHKHPELLQKPQDEVDDAWFLQRSKEIWDGYYQGRQFHQEPLYPYLMGLCYSLAGADEAEPMAADGPVLFYLLQLGMGLASLALLYLVTRRLFGLGVAVAATLLAIGYAPLLHFELKLLRVSLLVLLGIALLWTFQSFLGPGALQRRGRLKLFGLGLLIGVAMLGKLTLLPFGLVLVAALLWPRRSDLRRCTEYAALVGLGIALPLLPVLWRNLEVGAPLLGLSSVAPVTFAVSNLPGFVPSFGWFPHPMSPQLADILHQSQGRSLDTVAATLSQHTGLFGYLDLCWQKFCMIWHWFELPNNSSLYFNQLYSPLLWLLPVKFWMLVPLALLGLGVAWRRRTPGLWIWLCYLAVSLAPMLVFYTLSRFRVPFTFALLPFAALGGWQILAWLRQRSWLPLALAGTPMLLFAAFMLRDIPTPRPVISGGIYRFAHDNYFRPEAQRHTTAGRFMAAVGVFERFLESAPPLVRQVPDVEVRLSADEASLMGMYAQVYRDLGRLAQQLGRRDLFTRYADLFKRLRRRIDLAHERNQKK